MIATLLVPMLAGVLAPRPDSALKAQLEVLARRSIWFGHQSVGANLLDGISELAAAEGVAVHLVQGRPAPATFAHAFVPENGDPVRKLQGYARALDPAPQIALFKFCFVDFDAQTDVKALFARYQATVAALQAEHPRTVFVHVTVPLTTVQTGPKAWVKSLLGRPAGGVAENARREQYNALLRGAYQGREPVFDLASLESTRPDGSRQTAPLQNLAVPALVPDYSSDGAHLDEQGRLRIARELVALLAGIAVR